MEHVREIELDRNNWLWRQRMPGEYRRDRVEGVKRILEMDKVYRGTEEEVNAGVNYEDAWKTCQGWAVEEEE